MAVAGFCDPHSKDDVTPGDAEMWEASADNAPDGLSVEQSKYCLELLKADFDLIISEERRAMKENIGEENAVSWKRVVQGVSESCDVCDATLFNLHWACPRCGFVVCLHCYVGRKDQNKILNGETKSKDFVCAIVMFFSYSILALQVIRLTSPRPLPKMKKTNTRGFCAPIGPNMTWTS